MRETTITFATRGIEIGIIVTTFLMPLFIFPLFSPGAVFEFAKQMLLYVTAGSLVLLWAVRLLAEGRIEILRTPIDLPLILLVFFSFVSAFFSLDRETSIFGPYPQLYGGLLSLLSYIVFYVLVVSNIEHREQFLRVIKALIASVFAVAVLALLGFLRIDMGSFTFPHVYLRPVGSWDTTAYWLAPLIPLFVGLFFFSEKMKIFRWVVAFITVLALIIVTLADIPIVNIVIIGSVFALLFLVRSEKLKQYAVWLGIFILLWGALLILNVDELKNDIPYLEDLGVTHDIRMKHNFAWFITSSAFPDPKLLLLGSGPGTFTFDFVRFKPLIYNYTAFWNIRFNESSSELFQMISTMGILGSIAYFFLIGISLIIIGGKEFLRKGKEETFLFLGFGLALFAHFLLQLTRTMNSAHAFSFWLLLGLTWAGFNVWKKDHVVKPFRISLTAISIPKNLKGGELLEKKEIMPLAFFFVVVLVMGTFLFFETKYIFAEISYKKTLSREGDTNSLVRYAARSVSLMPQNEFYRMNRSQVHMRAARSLAAVSDLQEEDRGNIVNLLVSSRNEADAAYLMNPYNVMTSENRGNVYTVLASFSSDTLLVEEAIKSYQRARQLNQFTFLDFYNPRLPYLIGLLELNLKNSPDAAIESFRVAVNLKNDYAPAHYSLAKAYAAEERIQEAIERLDTVISLYDPLLIEKGKGIDIFQLQDLGGRRKEDIEAERERLKVLPQEPVPSGESSPEQ